VNRKLRGTLHAARTLAFVIWWMAVAFAGIFVFYMMTQAS
jgi:hypothetical protein